MISANSKPNRSPSLPGPSGPAIGRLSVLPVDLSDRSLRAGARPGTWPKSENVMPLRIDQVSVGQSPPPSHARAMQMIAATVAPEFQCGTES
jgi:hypothetical protein